MAEAHELVPSLDVILGVLLSSELKQRAREGRWPDLWEEVAKG